MSPDLTAEYAHLDTRTDGFITRVRSFPPEVQTAPVGKSYSPLKVVEHMYLVERSYVELAEKFDRQKYACKKGNASFIYKFVLKNMAKPSNFAAPTLKKFVPQQAMPLDDSTAKWKAERAKLVAHLSQFNDDDAAINHPLFGLLSPREMFILEEKHQDYHGVRLPV